MSCATSGKDGYIVTLVSVLSVILDPDVVAFSKSQNINEMNEGGQYVPLVS